MKKLLALAAALCRPCLALSCVLILYAAPRACGFTALVAFGDSYTDTGNYPSSPPYYWNGRFSNGPLWVEYLSQNLGLAYNAANNFAVSGSQAEDLGGQISGYNQTSDSGSALFAIWSGNNDFEANLGLGRSDSGWNNVINDAISSLMAASDLLYQKGACNLVLFNQIDLTRVPFMQNNYSASFRSYILGKIQIFNSRLSVALPNLRDSHPGLQVYYADIYSDLNYLLNNYYSYGFTHTTSALNDPSLPDTSFDGPGADYVFWDDDHPTTKTHGIVSSWVASVLPIAPPPQISLTSPSDGASFNAPGPVAVSADVTPNGWSISQVSFFANGNPIGQITAQPWSITWSSVPQGSYSLSAQVTFGAGATATSQPIQISVSPAGASPPPAPWNHQDIGAVGQPGSVYYSADGAFMIGGSGSDIWDTADAFQYVYQPITGDGTIIAHVTAMQNTDGFAKAGVMFRETLDAGSRNVLQFITPASGIGFQTRSASGGTSSYTQGGGGTPAYWLRLDRSGNLFKGYDSPDGTQWTLTSSITVPMASTVFVGMAVTSHNNSMLNTSTFTSTQITQPRTPPVLSILKLPDGSMQITLLGAIGMSYRLDTSPDLKAWTPLSTNLNTSGMLQITDSQARNLSRRFYRAALLN